MDDSDRIESQESPGAIPDHLVFAIEEWLEEQIRQRCDGYDGEASRRAVVEAVHLYDGFVTVAQVAELADGAGDWLGPRWPRTQHEAEEVTRLLSATRGLLALRDRALAAASERPPRAEQGHEAQMYRIEVSVFSADPELVDVLRLQTLLVLEVNHEPFEEVQELAPSELLDVANDLPHAIVVLDTIGWLETEQTEAMNLVITPGHFAQL